MSDFDRRLCKVEQDLEVISGNQADVSGNKPTALDDEIDLRELWLVAWSQKWLLIGVTIFFTVASVFYSASMPNVFRSAALLAPADENSGGGLAGMAGSLGGLASLAGVNFGNGNDKTAIAIEVLKSRAFLTRFIGKHDLDVPLLAAKGWNRSENQIILDDGVYDGESKTWVRDVAPPRVAKPSDQELFQEFIQLLSISTDKETGLVTLSIEHYSPFLAKKWVELLVEEINSEMRLRDVTEARKSIHYLTSQLEKTPIADMHAVFYELIEEQTKTIMFAEVREEYVFKTIDPAIVPEIKSKPQRLLIAVLGFILGAVSATVYVFISYLFRRR